MKNRKMPQQNKESSFLVLDESESNLEVLPEFLLDDSLDGITIVVKHNYYSSDTDHGKDLLAAFFDVMIDDPKRVARLLFLDSGVRLFHPDDTLFQVTRRLQAAGIPLILCRESLYYYKIEIDRSSGLEILSSHEIALEILNSPFVSVLS